MNVIGLGDLALEIRSVQQLEGAFAAMTRERADAVLVVADGMFGHHRTRLADLAVKHRLPSMHGLTENVEAGGLMSEDGQGARRHHSPGGAGEVAEQMHSVEH